MKFVVLALLAFCACVSVASVHFSTDTIPSTIAFSLDVEYKKYASTGNEVSIVTYDSALLGYSTLHQYTEKVGNETHRISVTTRYDWRREEEEKGEKYWVFPQFYFDSSSEEQCEKRDMLEEDMGKVIQELTETLQRDEDFEHSRETVFNGTACKMYYNVENNGETDTHCYAVNKKLIGIYWWRRNPNTGDKEEERTITIVYKDDPTPSTFVLDKNLYPGCSEEAYTLGPDPVVASSSATSSQSHTSGTSGSGSTGSAATNAASLAVVSLLVALVLLF